MNRTKPQLGITQLLIQKPACAVHTPLVTLNANSHLCFKQARDQLPHGATASAHPLHLAPEMKGPESSPEAAPEVYETRAPDLRTRTKVNRWKGNMRLDVTQHLLKSVCLMLITNNTSQGQTDLSSDTAQTLQTTASAVNLISMHVWKEQHIRNLN